MVFKAYLHMLSCFILKKNEYEKNQSYEILDSILYPDLA